MRSEVLWAEANEKLIERVRTYPPPPIFINGKRWDEWEPKINKLGDDLP